DCAVACGEAHLHGLALRVLDRVAQEVSQDPFHPPDVNLRDDRVWRHVYVHSDPSPLGYRGESIDDALGQRAQVRRLGLECGESRVKAADLEEIGQQALKAVQLRLQQLG